MTKNFTIEELTSSSFALKNNLDNTPNEIQLQNLKEGAHVLEFIRESFGNYPIVITSGFRSKAVNQGVGGAKYSDHQNGKAFDIIIKNGKKQEDNARVLKNKLENYDQIISYKTFTHLGLGDRSRREFINKGK